jgi:hypothetical protein
MYKVELSRGSVAVGGVIVLGFVVAAAVASRDAGSDKGETYLEQRLGSGYILVVGIAALCLALYLGRGLVLAWRHRDALISVDDQTIEIQTIRGRRRLNRSQVASVEYDTRKRALVVTDRNGRHLNPVLRPRGTTWSEVSETLASLLGQQGAIRD